MKENETKKFNQNDYIKEYKKQHYKNMNVACNPEDAEKITNYCKDMNISRQKFIIKAVLYAIDNNLIDEIFT